MRGKTRFVILALLLCVAGRSYGQELTLEQTSGPISAEVQMLTGGPEGELFARADGQLFRSLHDGHSWTLIKEPSIHLFAVSTGGVLLAGTAGTRTTRGSGCHQNLFRSIDQGNSWEPAAVETADNCVHEFAAGGSGYLYADTDEGLFRSVDGASWSPVDVMLERIRSFAARPGVGLLVGGSDSLFYSTDRGDSWQAGPLPSDTLAFDHLEIGPDTTFYAWNQEHLFRTEAVGGSWQPIQPSDTSGTNHALFVDAGGRLYLGAGSSIYRSDNAGDTWLVEDAPGAKAVSFVRTAKGDLLAGTGAGLYRQDEDQQWTASSEGLITTKIMALYSAPSGDLWAGGFYDGLFRSGDGGGSWERLRNFEAIKAITSMGDSTIAVGQVGTPGLLYTSDNGETWKEVDLPNIGSLAVIPGGAVLAGAVGRSTGGVYRSTDGAQTWAASGLGSYEVQALLVTGESGDVLAGTLEGGIFRSEDGGQTWTSDGLSGQRVNALAATGSTVVAFSEGTIYRKASAAAEWTSVHETQAHVSSFAAAEDIVYAAADEAILYSGDEGRKWTAAHETSAGGKMVESLTIGPEGYLYVGTWGGGVYRSTATALNAPADPPRALPQKLKLHENYPNPFNPQTTIRYSLPRRMHVKLGVYDAIGRKVTVLVENTQAAGRYSASFDGSNLPSGLYIYRLETGARILTESMLLVK